jgi:hypothetical protein
MSQSIQYASGGNSGSAQPHARDRGRRGNALARAVRVVRHACLEHARCLGRIGLTTARPLWLGVTIGFVLTPRPAEAACERELDLAAAVAHAGRGHVAAQQDKFALARAQCGEAALGARAAASDTPARESRQLSLYPSTANTPPPTANIASPQTRGRGRASSMASMSSVAPSVPPTDGGRARGSSGTTPPSVHGNRSDGRLTVPRRNPQFVPVRMPSKTTLRVQALADTMSSAATRYRLDPLLLHAIASIESNHDASARSSAGAIGVMQVMPDTARRFGVREPERTLHDPAVNIDVSAAYLSGLRLQYENNLPLMLAAYNAGEGAVERHGYRVPPYAETQNYVKRVLDMYDELHRRTGRHMTRVRTTAHIGGTPVMDPAPAPVRPRDQAL